MPVGGTANGIDVTLGRMHCRGSPLECAPAPNTRSLGVTDLIAGSSIHVAFAGPLSRPSDDILRAMEPAGGVTCTS